MIDIDSEQALDRVREEFVKNFTNSSSGRNFSFF